jgi:transposase-like protein
MATRVCAACGKTKDLSGGKTCDKEHFICKSCAYSYSKCPLDGTKLK